MTDCLTVRRAAAVCHSRSSSSVASWAVLSFAALAACALPAPLRAGEIAVEGHVGTFGMSASDTAKAVFDSTGGPTFGGAVRYRFWRGAFATVGARTFSKDGERVFVATPSSPVQKLGFPLSMRLTPVLATVGYRVELGRRFEPYVAAGLALTHYTETSVVAAETFDDTFWKAGFTGGVGLEARVYRQFRLAAEGGFSRIPNAIGRSDNGTHMGGVARVYDEHDIGGLYAIGKVVVAFGIGKPRARADEPQEERRLEPRRQRRPAETEDEEPDAEPPAPEPRT